MKSLFMAILTLGALYATASEIDIDLDGKEFCRVVETGGLFGQPKGLREHCVSFYEGKMSDNANTFFGNPPTRVDYSIVAKTKVFTNEDGVETQQFDILNEGTELGVISDKSDGYSYILELKIKK
jgi:hypothetical protein